MKKILLLFVLMISITSISKAQFTLSGYGDAYYAWDTDKDKSQRQYAAFAPFRDEFKLNIALLTASYNSELVRGVVALQYGDIPRIGWPSNQQFIQQANVGFRLAKNFWVDAGYFITHIGAESVLPKDNWFSMFSIGSYYEPFYQSGFRFSYKFSDQFAAQLHLCNGYNLFDDNNKNKSLGLELKYDPSEQLSIEYNGMIGNEMPTGVNGLTRILNNVVATYYATPELTLMGNIEMISQEKSKLTDPEASASEFSGFVAARYQVHPKVYLAGRVEYFNDENGFMSGTFIDTDGKTTGLKCFGVALGVEYRPVNNAYIRLDSRYLSADSKQKLFYENDNNRVEVILSTGFEFSKVFNDE